MKKLYTINCPVEEIWVMQVEAESPEEALSLLRTGAAYQTHSFSGTTKSGRPEVVDERPIEEDKE